MSELSAPNSRAAIIERRAAGEIHWSGPVLMLLARSVLAVVAQGLVAVVLSVQGSASPWREAGSWLPVYGTLIDAGCLYALWRLARREKIGLIDLTGLDRRRLGRDVLLGLALIPPSLLLILAGNYGSSLLAFGNLDAPDVLAPLPLPAALYAVLVFPLVWGITEQATYNGYVLPRFQALSRNTSFAVAAVAFFWSFQHALMPLTLDPDFMLYRALAPIPFSTFQALLYPAHSTDRAIRDRALADGRRRRVLPYAMAPSGLRRRFEPAPARSAPTAAGPWQQYRIKPDSMRAATGEAPVRLSGRRVCAGGSRHGCGASSSRSGGTPTGSSGEHRRWGSCQT